MKGLIAARRDWFADTGFCLGVSHNKRNLPISNKTNGGDNFDSFMNYKYFSNGSSNLILFWLKKCKKYIKHEWFHRIIPIDCIDVNFDIIASNVHYEHNIYETASVASKIILHIYCVKCSIAFEKWEMLIELLKQRSGQELCVEWAFGQSPEIMQWKWNHEILNSTQITFCPSVRCVIGVMVMACMIYVDYVPRALRLLIQRTNVNTLKTPFNILWWGWKYFAATTHLSIFSILLNCRSLQIAHSDVKGPP